MNAFSKTSRVLGLAFLLQFVTSFLSGTLLNPTWLAPGNIGETMAKIADKPWLFQLNILVDMLTAFGIVFLGAQLFLTLQKQSKTIALLAFGLYIIEAALLAASKLPAFSLLRISQEYIANGQSAIFQTLGILALDSMNFVGSTLHMLTFGLGAILFYILLYRSGVVPRALSLWGLVTVILVLIATITSLLGSVLPFYVYVPYIPFELAIAIWILVKGIKAEAETKPAITKLSRKMIITEEK
jgi:hypothetical protein